MWIWPIEETEEDSITKLYNLARPAPAAFRDTFRSLSVRNFRLFFFGQLLSQTGTWMTMVAQTLLILDLTGSGVLLGLLGAAQFGPVLLFGAWAGAVADRVNKRKVLFATQVGAMGQSLVLGLVVLTGNATVVTVFALAAVQGILTAFDNPARRAFVVEMVPNDNLANAVSLNSTLMTTSRVLGPALAGVLIGLVGYAWCFLADSISYLAVLAALAMMRPSELFPSKPAPRAPGQIRAGLRYVASSRDQLVPLVMMAIIGTLAFNFAVTTPLLVTGPLGGSKQAYTLLLSTMSLGSVIGAVATARRTRSSLSTSHLVDSHLRDRNAAPGSCSGAVDGLSDCGCRWSWQHRLHDNRHGDDATRRRPPVQRARARAAGDGVSGHNSDRRPDRWADCRSLRSPRRDRDWAVWHVWGQPSGRAEAGTGAPSSPLPPPRRCLSTEG